MMSQYLFLRQYSITSSEDDDNILNNRCPEYAMKWLNVNDYYWPSGHDYFIGNGKNIKDNYELRYILSKKLSKGTLPKKLVFCDLDGVLTDFEKGILNKFNKKPYELKSGLMWGVINKSNTFFETLTWMPKGRQLWEQIRKYDPIILTGVPNSASAAEQKHRWCARELGPDIDVITCFSKDKPKYCIPNSILIDDRTDNLNAWNKKGGLFLVYEEDLLDEIVDRIEKYMEADDI